MFRRLRSSGLYAAYLLVTVGAILYLLFWLPFVGTLRERQAPGPGGFPPVADVSEQTLRLVGSLRSDRPGAFSEFQLEKPIGTERVCAFGDSFTYGAEVAPGHDFPAFLQQLVNDARIAEVQVLNFGNSWHGFHQNYLLWDRVGRGYHCDYVLLGPASFQAKRDTELNHTQLHYPYFLHARFVQHGPDDAELVEVFGETRQERFEEYFRFLPRWRYLRYDRNPPPLVQALIPRNRTLGNPFYYDSRSADQEALALQGILLRRMAATGTQIVVVHRWPTVVQMASELGFDNVVAAPAFDQYRFPYRAPHGHNSAWSNRVLAEQFLAHLLGDEKRRVIILETSDAEWLPPGVRASTTHPIEAFDRIVVRLGDTAVGHLVTASRDIVRAGHGDPSSLFDSGVVSLLGLKDPRIAAPDAGFISLRRPLVEGAALVLVSGDGPEKQERQVGTVRLLHAAAPIGLANVEGLELRNRQELVLHTSPDSASERVSLLLDGEPILHGFSTDGVAVLYPAEGQLLQLAPDGNGYLDVDRLPDEGRLDLVLSQPDATPLTVPLARWRKRSMLMAVASAKLPRPLGSLRRARAEETSAQHSRANRD